MKKICKASITIFAVALSFVSNSCDKFDTFELNVAFPIEDIVTQGGSNQTTADTVSYCLRQSATYKDYVDNIEKLTYLEAAWRTDSVSNITTGDVTVTVRIVNGAILFQKTLSGINPSDYKNPNGPFVLSLSESETALLNSYLETYRTDSFNAPCLQAFATALVTAGTGYHYLRGTVDLLVKAKTKL